MNKIEKKIAELKKQRDKIDMQIEVLEEFIGQDLGSFEPVEKKKRVVEKSTGPKYTTNPDGTVTVTGWKPGMVDQSRTQAQNKELKDYKIENIKTGTYTGKARVHTIGGPMAGKFVDGEGVDI